MTKKLDIKGNTEEKKGFTFTNLKPIELQEAKMSQTKLRVEKLAEKNATSTL